MSKPISISLSPNTEKDDVSLALRLMAMPRLWRRGKAITELENEFKKYLGVKYAVSFNSGRSALFAILKALGFQKSNEILLQAFTCNAVPNPVMWAGLKPVYVDCREDDYNMDPVDLERKITLRQAQGGRPRAVIIQHTFGLPADIDAIQAICQKHNLVLIEDCAHALGARYKGKLVGAFGKASFFSFSRDKVISSVYGGMAATNDHAMGKALENLQKEFGLPSWYWTFQQILHPILLHYVILPLYNVMDLGKIFLIVSQWVGVLSKAVHWLEKRGRKPGYFPKAFPNALAVLAFNQFRKLERFNAHRKELAEFYSRELSNTKYQILNTKYSDGSIFLRFPLKHRNAHEIIYESWHKRNILLGDWYTSPIAPDDTRLEAMQYQKGSCKVAEKLSQTTLNLPTHINISEKEARIIIDFLLIL